MQMDKRYDKHQIVSQSVQYGGVTPVGIYIALFACIAALISLPFCHSEVQGYIDQHYQDAMQAIEDGATHNAELQDIAVSEAKTAYNNGQKSEILFAQDYDVINGADNGTRYKFVSNPPEKQLDGIAAYSFRINGGMYGSKACIKICFDDNGNVVSSDWVDAKTMENINDCFVK